MSKASTTFDIKTYAYTDCREQHVWKPYDGHIDKKNKLGIQVQRCNQCGMKRRRVLDISSTAKPYGKVLSRTYIAPVDYYVKGGLSAGELGQIRVRNFIEALKGK